MPVLNATPRQATPKQVLFISLVYILSLQISTLPVSMYTVCIISVPIFVSNRILISPRSWNKKSQQPISNVIYQSKHIALLHNMKWRKVPGVPSGANSVKCFVLAPHPSLIKIKSRLLIHLPSLFQPGYCHPCHSQQKGRT